MTAPIWIPPAARGRTEPDQPWITRRQLRRIHKDVRRRQFTKLGKTRGK